MPEDERAETAQEREVEAVTTEESETPERSATASQAGRLDNVEGGHELALEGERVEVTTE